MNRLILDKEFEPFNGRRTLTYSLEIFGVLFYVALSEVYFLREFDCC